MSVACSVCLVRTRSASLVQRHYRRPASQGRRQWEVSAITVCLRLCRDLSSLSSGVKNDSVRDSTSLIPQLRDLSKDCQLLALGFSDGLHYAISVISETFPMFGPFETKLVRDQRVSQDVFPPHKLLLESVLIGLNGFGWWNQGLKSLP